MNGLSFDQAPPFSLPLRFFLTAPAFLLAAGVLLALAPSALASRWTPAALALTHLMTLGYLGSTMLGALLQVLPVVAGAPVPRVRAVGAAVHAALVAGTVVLVGALLTGAPTAYRVALVLLVGGLAVFVVAAATSLARAARSATAAGLRFAVAGLAVTVLLAVALVLARAGLGAPPAWAPLLDAHVGFGLVGWVLMLVAAVAWQVVPMFQLTPRYPAWLVRSLPTLLFVAVAVGALAPPLAGADETVVAAGVLVFAAVTLDLQRRRRRRVRDVTLRFWRLGMASLIGCVGVWGAGRWLPAWSNGDAYPLVLGVLFLVGFGGSVVSGMLYKIVPFLAWFHLQTQLGAPAGSIPTMKTLIPERALRWHFRSHVLACVALVVAPQAPTTLGAWAGVALALSALLLGGNLLVATRRFLRHGGRP